MIKHTINLLIKCSFLFVMYLLIPTSANADDNDIKTEGVIESIVTNSLVVNGLIFDVDIKTEVKDENGDIVFNNLTSGDFVEVEGKLVSEKRYYAQKIERESMGNNGDDDHVDELETKGLISWIGKDSIEVNGYLFFVTANTRLKGSHGINITFDQLKVGMHVEVEGHFVGNGSLVADEIELEEVDLEHELEFYGHIVSVLDNEITIGKKPIQVNSVTIIKLTNNQLGSFNDLAVGQFVEIKAAVLGDGSLLAVRIKLEDNVENEIEFVGRIDSVGTDFIEMLDYHINMDAHTIIINHEKVLLTQADLDKGQRVEIKGQLISEHVIQARRIKVKRFHENEIEFTGQVTMINLNQIRVGDTFFIITGITVILNNENQNITQDQIQQGQFVEIKGILNKDGSLTALRIKIEDRGQDEVELTGRIESLTLDAITVAGVTFSVNDMTVVLDLQGNIITFSDLKTDDLVEIKGILLSNGSLNAVRIKQEDTPGLIIVSGDITTVNDDGLQIAGPPFLNTQSSVFLDESYNEITLGHFNNDDPVTIWAVQTKAGNLIIQVKMSTNNSVTTIKNNVSLPETIQLYANFPNPFNPETHITFTLNSNGFIHVQLGVYDIVGRKVRTLFNGQLDQGNYSFKWDGQNEQDTSVASGLYIYMLSSGNTVLTRKMTLIR